MARGHRLNTSIVLAAVHGLWSFSGGIRGRAFTLSFPPVPNNLNKHPRFCGRKATCKMKKTLLLTSRAYLSTTSVVLLTRVAYQESRLLILRRLSARLVNRDKDLVVGVL